MTICPIVRSDMLRLLPDKTSIAYHLQRFDYTKAVAWTFYVSVFVILQEAIL